EQHADAEPQREPGDGGRRAGSPGRRPLDRIELVVEPGVAAVDGEAEAEDHQHERPEGHRWKGRSTRAVNSAVRVWGRTTRTRRATPTAATLATVRAAGSSRSLVTNASANAPPASRP